VLLPSEFYLWNKLVYHLVADICFAICLAICTYCYCKIYRVVRQHQFQIHAQQQVVESTNIGKKHGKIEKKCIEHLRILHLYGDMLFSTCCFIDFGWNVIQRLENRVDFCFHGNIYELILNLILYCWRLSELRLAVLKIAMIEN